MMNSSENPTFLYHFTKGETALTHILPSMSLRMNRLAKMNDPSENLFHNINSEVNIRKIDWENYCYSDIVAKNTCILCFSVDFKKNDLDIESYKLQRMWAMYGNVNKGVCLKINFNRFVIENEEIINREKIIFDKVKYDVHTNSKVDGYSYYKMPDKTRNYSCLERFQEIRKNKEFVLNRFFTKYIDWEYESEYRFLAFNDNKEQLLLSIKDSLEEVILGLNYPKSELNDLLPLYPKANISIIDFNGSFRKDLLTSLKY